MRTRQNKSKYLGSIFLDDNSGQGYGLFNATEADIVLEVKIGQIVRIYHDEDCYDEGFIRSVTEVIEVDFYDWIETWPLTAEFMTHALHHERREFLMPLQPGTITVQF